MICARGFGLCPLLETVILYRLLSFGGELAVRCPDSQCPLLGGSKYTISMGKVIGGMEFVRCTEVVRLSESPLIRDFTVCQGSKSLPEMAYGAADIHMFVLYKPL